MPEVPREALEAILKATRRDGSGFYGRDGPVITKYRCAVCGLEWNRKMVKDPNYPWDTRDQEEEPEKHKPDCPVAAVRNALG